MDGNAAGCRMVRTQIGPFFRLEGSGICNFAVDVGLGGFLVEIDSRHQKEMNKKPIFVILGLLVALSIAFKLLTTTFPDYRFAVLEGGNILMAVLSLASYLMVANSLHGSPNAFVRGIMGATMLKLFVCLAAMLTYVVLNRKDIHKPSIFVLFGLYAIYTIVETAAVTGLSRKK
jgi:Ca2+/Na+ antiporter